MKKVYEETKRKLKERYNIDITEQEIDSIYVKFIRACIREKHSNLLRNIYLPTFGTIKISKGKLERATKWAFKRRDKIKVPFYIKALRILRKNLKQYWNYVNELDQIKKHTKIIENDN